MPVEQTDSSVTAIVESIRQKVERRAAGRPRTPPFDPQLVNHIVRMRGAADLYQAPLVQGTGLAARATAFIRKIARRALLPWIARQSAYNGTNTIAVDALRDQIELVAYHQALTTEDLLDVQAHAFEAAAHRHDDVVALQQELPRLADGLAALRTELQDTVAAVSALRSEVASLGARLDEQHPTPREVGSGAAELRAYVEQRAAAHDTMARLLRERIARVERRIRRWQEPGASAPPVAPADVPEPAVPDFDYAGFEERMRGSEDEIRERQRAYLPYFAGAARVVDLGCGRGEFLELLRDTGIAGEGVELDTDMVLCSRDKGLRVTQTDLRAWLADQPAESLGGIMSAQVVEHMPAAEVIRLMGLAHRALAPGGHLVVETVNPGSVGALTSFFVDFTHVRPLHPEAMRFLFESLGFTDVEVRYSGFVDPAVQIPEIPDTPDQTTAAALFNPAIRRVNGLLYGPYDYAVIGRKAGPHGG